MRRNGARIFSCCAALLAAIVATYVGAEEPKKDGTSASPIGAPPPCVCPLWPIDEVPTPYGTEYLYYSECYLTESCMGDSEPGYLEGTFPWPVFCPSDDCVDVSNLKPGEKIRLDRKPKDFQGLKDFAAVNDRFIRQFPTPVARRHARELAPLKLEGEPVRFVWIDVNRTRHFFEIVRIEVAVPSEDSEGRAETRSREILLGKEIQAPPEGVTPVEVQTPTPIDKLGKPVDSSLAYRGKIANRSALFLFKAP